MPIDIPASMLTCAPQPAVPAAPCDQACVASFMAQTYMAGDDCRRKLAGVRELVETGE